MMRIGMLTNKAERKATLGEAYHLRKTYFEEVESEGGGGAVQNI